MLARTVRWPKGSSIIRSGRRIHRRQKVCSGSSTAPQPTRAGSRFAAARSIAAAIRAGRVAAYSTSGGVPSAPITEGAECVCVAEISIRSTGIPVFSRAIALARSISSRGIMQLSTTTIASRVEPSSSTRALRPDRVVQLRLARAARNPPLTMTGKSLGRDVDRRGAGAEDRLLGRRTGRTCQTRQAAAREDRDEGCVS